MRRKAFWGQSGRMTRQVEGLVNDVLLDCCIGPLGIGLIERATGKHLRWLPWAELHRLAQQGPLQQLGAAVAERSEPRTEEEIIEYDGRRFVRTGVRRLPRKDEWFMSENLISNHPIKAAMDFVSEIRDLLLEVTHGLRILPVEEK